MSSFSIIQSFLLNQASPLDVKEVCADQTTRLAIVYPYKGLVSKQYDTGQLFRYITTTPVDGSIPTNLVTDWELVPTVFTGSGVPLTTKGVISDIWIDEIGFVIYKKTGTSTWTVLFTISGSQITTGAGVPSNASGNNGDMYVRSDGGVYTKAAGVWTLQFNIKGANGVSDKFATTSATSLDMTTVVAPLNLTVGTGLSWTVGQSMLIASRATPSKTLTGTVTSYTSGTGAVILSPITPAGAAGAVTDWDVNLSGSPGQIGKAFVHTEADINFNDAKVTAVQAGTYTKANPWAASVSNDTRSSFSVPSTLMGSMTGHSILYDGASWYDNGRWLGFTGAPGASVTGPPGPVSTVPGPPGIIPFIVIPFVGNYYSIINLSKAWYVIEVPNTGTIGLDNGCEQGTVITINRLNLSPNSQVIQPTSFYPTPFIIRVGQTLRYKGAAVDSIPSSCRSITFISLGPTSGWACIGEDQFIDTSIQDTYDGSNYTNPGGSPVTILTIPTINGFNYLVEVDMSSVIISGDTVGSGGFMKLIRSVRNISNTLNLGAQTTVYNNTSTSSAPTITIDISGTNIIIRTSFSGSGTTYLVRCKAKLVPVGVYT